MAYQKVCKQGRVMHERKGQRISKAPSLHLFHTTVRQPVCMGVFLKCRYHKLPLDEAKTMPCILQHYHTSALTAAHLYNLDPSLSGLQTGHSNQCVKLKYLCTALTTWMGADSALKDAI